MQVNDRREQALIDTHNILVDMNVFKDIGYMAKHPEEVSDFPAVYLVTGGLGERKPANLLNTLFDHEMQIIAYVYHRQKQEGELYLELERLLAKMLDTLDLAGQTLSQTEGYDLFVSAIETDEGTLGGTGLPIALAILTITALLPARDAI